jgi:hypothetical protein
MLARKIVVSFLMVLLMTTLLTAAAQDKFVDKNDGGNPFYVSYLAADMQDGRILFRRLPEPILKTAESFLNTWYFWWGNEIMVASLAEPSQPKREQMQSDAQRIIAKAQEYVCDVNTCPPAPFTFGRIVYASCGYGCVKPIGCSASGTGLGCTLLPIH